jgi:two-component system, response regulator PdtaR
MFDMLRPDPPSELPGQGASASTSCDRIDVWENEGGAGRREAKPPIRILIVEDDALIAVLFGKLLEDMGYDVCAIEPSEVLAVAAAARCRPDLMLVDAWLGDGSGVSAVQQILRSRFVPHVFVTGDASALKAVRPDAVTLSKPFREADLSLAIERALASRPV